jgi:hypothetical protein
MFDEGARVVARAMLAWPTVASLVGCTDPRRLFERALWDLARWLEWRETARQRLAVLRRVAAAAPAGSGVAADVNRQLAGAQALVDSREREVLRRLTDLRRLANACDDFRQARSPASRLTASQPHPAYDRDERSRGVDVGEIASHAEYVVGAYRELLAWPDRPG